MAICRILKTLEGEAALRWFAANGASASEVAFLRGAVAEGAILRVVEGAGEVPLEFTVGDGGGEFVSGCVVAQQSRTTKQGPVQCEVRFRIGDSA